MTDMRKGFEDGRANFSTASVVIPDQLMDQLEAEIGLKTQIAQAANVAWHIRTNGMVHVTPENIQLMADVLDHLLKREGLVQLLLERLSGSQEIADLVQQIKG